MSADSKRIKIVSLVTLAYGVVGIIAGIVLLATGSGLAGALVLVSGVLSGILGVRGALIANVPSNTPQLEKLSGGLFVVQAADSGCIVAVNGPEQVNQDPLALCLALVSVLLALFLLILSHRLKKQLEAK